MRIEPVGVGSRSHFKFRVSGSEFWLLIFVLFLDEEVWVQSLNLKIWKFLSIAKGSCGETRSQLYRIFDRNYIDKDKFNELTVITNELGNKIGSFIKYLNYTEYKGTKFKS